MTPYKIIIIRWRISTYFCISFHLHSACIFPNTCRCRSRQCWRTAAHSHAQPCCRCPYLRGVRSVKKIFKVRFITSLSCFKSLFKIFTHLFSLEMIDIVEDCFRFILYYINIKDVLVICLNRVLFWCLHPSPCYDKHSSLI